MKASGRVVINGREFSCHNLQISGNKMIIDGVVQDSELVGNVKVDVHGDIDRLETSCGDVTAQNVGSIITKSGDVECGAVAGSIKTMSGDVTCGAVAGSIKTMSGDIRHR